MKTRNASYGSDGSSGGGSPPVNETRSVDTMDKEIETLMSDLNKNLEDREKLPSQGDVRYGVYSDLITRIYHALLGLMDERLEALGSVHVDTPRPSSFRHGTRSPTVIDGDVVTLYNLYKSNKAKKKRKSQGNVESCRLKEESSIVTQHRLRDLVEERIRAQELQEAEDLRVLGIEQPHDGVSTVGGLFGSPPPTAGSAILPAGTASTIHSSGTRARVEQAQERVTTVGGMFGSSTPVASFASLRTGSASTAPFSSNTPATNGFAAYTTPANTPATSGFASSSGGTPSSGFGSTSAPPPTSTSQPRLGLASSSTSHDSLLSGVPPQVGGLYGQPAPEGMTGTGFIPFQPTVMTDGASSGQSVVFQSITAMPEYGASGQSFEELRYHDYMQGNRGSAAVQQSNGFGSSGNVGLFGATPPAPTTAPGSQLSSTELHNLFGVFFPAPASSNGTLGSLFSHRGGGWKCEFCCASNATSDATCAFCDKPRDGLAGGAAATVSAHTTGSSTSAGNCSVGWGSVRWGSVPSNTSVPPFGDAGAAGTSTAASLSPFGSPDVSTRTLSQALSAATPAGSAMSNLPEDLTFSAYSQSTLASAPTTQPNLRFSFMPGSGGDGLQAGTPGGVVRDKVDTPGTDGAVGSVASTMHRFSLSSPSPAAATTPQSTNRSRRRISRKGKK